MKSNRKRTGATVEPVSKLLDVLKDKETRRVLKRLQRAIDALPANWTLNSEFAILLERSTQVFDSWVYLSERPDELKTAILEVEYPRA